MSTVNVFSFGGGVQSTAVLVLQATGRLPRDYDHFVFANVGNDSEHPDVINYYNARFPINYLCLIGGMIQVMSVILVFALCKVEE